MKAKFLHLLRPLMVGMVAMLGCEMASAQDTQWITVDDSLDYVIDPSTHTAAFAGFETMFNGTLTIPAVVNYEGADYSVTEVSDWACAYQDGLTAVVLGANVKKVGVEAFSNSAIQTFTAASALNFIDEAAFMGCASLTTLNLNEGLTAMGPNAFLNCTALSWFTLPSTLVTIDGNPWGGCSALEGFSVSEGNAKYSAVDGMLCTADGKTLLTFPAGKIDATGAVVLPEGIEAIGAGAFENMTALTAITFPNSLLSIGENAFCGTSLKRLSISVNLESIASTAFTNIEALEGFDVAEGNTHFKAEGPFLLSADGSQLVATVVVDGDLVIPDGVTAIAPDFFALNPITSLTTPASLRTIGEGAFANCLHLKEVNLAEGLQAIDGRAFMISYPDQYPGALEHINLPSTLSYIGDYCFSRQALVDLALPEGLDSIGECIAYQCSGLKTISMPSTLTKMGTGTCYECKSLESAVLAEGITDINDQSFNRCSKLSQVTFPTTLKSIGSSSFYGTNLSEIDLPEGFEVLGDASIYETKVKELHFPSTMTTIGEYAVAWCDSLETLTTGADLRTIKQFGISSNYALTSLTLNEGLTTLENNALCYLKALTELTIPSTVTAIGKGCFNGNAKMEKLVNLAVVPQELTKDIINAQYYETVALIVPEGSEEAYRTAPIWSKFTHIEAVPTTLNSLSSNGTKVIGTYTLQGRQAEPNAHGLLIERLSDGSTRKVVRN